MNLTVPEVAARLRCSEWAARRLINAPDGLRASKVAGRWLVTEEDVTTYQSAQSNRTVRRRRRRATA